MISEGGSSIWGANVSCLSAGKLFIAGGDHRVLIYQNLPYLGDIFQEPCPAGLKRFPDHQRHVFRQRYAYRGQIPVDASTHPSRFDYLAFSGFRRPDGLPVQLPSCRVLMVSGSPDEKHLHLARKFPSSNLAKPNLSNGQGWDLGRPGGAGFATGSGTGAGIVLSDIDRDGQPDF